MVTAPEFVEFPKGELGLIDWKVFPMQTAFRDSVEPRVCEDNLPLCLFVTTFEFLVERNPVGSFLDCLAGRLEA